MKGNAGWHLEPALPALKVDEVAVAPDDPPFSDQRQLGQACAADSRRSTRRNL
jgi:hypothetical protein